MRKLLIALPILMVTARLSFAACGDTTFTLTASYNPSALNNHIAACDDSTMVLKLKAAGGVDTVRLQDTIKVRSRPSGAVTRLVGEGAGGGYLVLTESDVARPTLIHVFNPDRASLSGFSFVRKALNNDRHTVEIRSKGSVITDCHFLMLDNSSVNQTGSLVSIAADSVLVERSVFRAPINGVGRSIAISGGTSGTSAPRNEYRSNVFHSTGIYLINGTFHVYANTFTGSRDPQHPIVVSGTMADPANNLNIEHNLFAVKDDKTSPIMFAISNFSSVKGVIKNAWSRAGAGQHFMVNISGGKVSGTDTAGANNNVVLPRGFSRYSPSAGEFKEYPIIQLRTDSNLASNPSTWRIPRVYANNVSNWTNIPDISSGLPAAKLYFPGFAPLVAGRSWSSEGQNIKVGALVDLDSRLPVTPLDSANLANSSIRISRAPGDSTQMKVTNLFWNRDYYKTQFNPSVLYFFFSNSSATLSSNDTTALKTAVGPGNWIRTPFSAFDSTDTVPKGVRTGNNIFVKMLHFNADGQAPVLSTGVIATLQAIPRFPANDLSVPALAGGTDSAAGLFNLSVTKQGDEDIDSIRVTVIQPGGGAVASQSKAAPNRNQTAGFSFNLPRGQFAFNALPVARVGSAFQTGPQTADTRFYNSQQSQADTVFLANRACTNANGTSLNPFCNLDTAMKALGPGGGTIVVKNMPGSTPFKEISLGGTESTPVVIMAPLSGGQFDPSNRVVFQGAVGKEAFSITRKNVTLRGLIFEMPAGASVPAVSIKADGATVDACLFRPMTSAAAAALAAHLEPGAAQPLRFINNVIWGYTTGLRVQSASNAIAILHNTFIKEPSVNSSAVVGLTAPGAVAATVANNWFSGVDTPYEGFAGKSATLDHNAYAGAAGDPLQGLTETGTIDSVARLGQLDLTQSTFATQLADGVDAVMICDAFKPCNGLYAGASATTQGGAVTTDFLGKARGGVPDIGALDAKAEASTVRGILSVEVRPIPAAVGGHEKLAFTVTRKTMDPQDVDSIYVWWADGAAVPFDGSKPFRKYPRSRLDDGNFVDTLTGLTPMKTYWVYAALGKVIGGDRKLGYGYRDDGTTDFKRDTSDCSFTAGSSVCPAAGGVFSVADGTAKDKYFTRISFALPDSGTVKVPKVEYATADITRGRVSVFRPFPLITLALESGLLKAKGTRQSWKAEITIKENPIEILKGRDLFIISDSSSSSSAYVPTWSIRPEGAEAVLTIEGHSAGTFTYAFGSQSGSVSADIQPADAEPPVFNFEDNATTSVPFKFRGTGFATSNPLVLVTPIPSSGRFADTYKRVIFGEHQNKTLVLSAGLAGMDDSLRADHLHRYYRRAMAADTATPAPAGRVKPFQLADANFDEFRNNLVLNTPDLAISAAGAAEEVSLNLPINKDYRIPRYYTPSTGHASNSIEVLFTVFDGAKVTRSSGYIRTRFTDEQLTSGEKSQRSPNAWHLFSFPWDEADASDLKHVLAIEEGKSWDPARHRIMRYKGSGTGKDAFEVYDGTNAAAFKYDAGSAIWSGGADFYTPEPKAGLSLDYKPFKLDFTAGQWNDFGLPFNFPIKWTDILAANPSWPAAQRVWRYIPSDPDKKQVATWAPLTPGNAASGEAQSVVHPWEGLTVNPVAGLFTTGTPSLTIPLLDSSRSSAPMVPAAKHAAGSTFWAAKVAAYNGTARTGLWIGVLDREDAFGQAPEVPGQDFRIAIREQGPAGDRLLSGLRRASAGGWQGHWALQGSASGQGIRLKAEENPKGIPLYLVETLSGRVTPLTPESEAALSPEDLKTGDYHLVAGDSRYLQSVLDGLVPLHMLDLANYPNPFAGSTLIRYALPESWGKAEFRLKIRDARGRLVWERDFRGSNTLRHLWDGRDRGGKAVGAGFYTLTLEAMTPGKAPRKAVRRMLKM